MLCWYKNMNIYGYNGHPFPSDVIHHSIFYIYYLLDTLPHISTPVLTLLIIRYFSGLFKYIFFGNFIQLCMICNFLIFTVRFLHQFISIPVIFPCNTCTHDCYSHILINLLIGWFIFSVYFLILAHIVPYISYLYQLINYRLRALIYSGVGHTFSGGKQIQSDSLLSYILNSLDLYSSSMALSVVTTEFLLTIIRYEPLVFLFRHLS